MIAYGAEDKGVLDYILSLKKIIKKKFFFVRSISEITKVKKKISLVITGSSYGNSLDQKIIRWSKKNTVISISIVDHWYNFKERFSNKLNLPDYIILNDKESFKKIKLLFPSIKQKLIIAGNPILFLLKKKKIQKKKTKKILLFVSEKIPKKFEKQKYLFIKQILFFLPKNYRLHIKLHPREKNTEYLNLKSYKLSVFRNYSLRKLILDPEIIFGIRSILLIKCAIFRNDILSLKIKGLQEKDFIPYKKKWLYPIANILKFKKIFFKQTKISNSQPIFYVSKQLINLIKRFT
jgi:hypothetical protein